MNQDPHRQISSGFHPPVTAPSMRELRAFYEADAARRDHWKSTGRETFVQLDALRYDRIMQELKGPYTTAVDLGCGSGILTQRLSTRAEKVVAMDLTCTRLHQVRSNVPSALLIQGDASAIPLRDSSVEVLVASELIEHLPDYRPSLAEMARILSPTGVCVVSVPYREEREEQVCPRCRHLFPLHGHYHSFDRDSLGAALTASGLSPVHFVTLNNAISTRLARLIAAPYRVMKLLDEVCRRLFPHMNRHVIAFACKTRRETQ